MTRHYHDIGGGADLVLPRRRHAAALLSLWLTKTYVRGIHYLNTSHGDSQPGVVPTRSARMCDASAQRQRTASGFDGVSK